MRCIVFVPSRWPWRHERDVRMSNLDKLINWPHKGISLWDLHNHMRRPGERTTGPPPVPIIDQCMTCHRQDTLRLVGGDEWMKYEWLCQKCGCITTDADLDQYVRWYLRDGDEMADPPPLVRLLLVQSAHTLFRISQGDTEAVENAGNSARQLIRMIEWGGPSEDWFAEAE